MNRNIRAGRAMQPPREDEAPREDAMAAAERLAALLGLRLGERIHGGASGSLVLKASRVDGTMVAIKVDQPARLCLAERAALATVGVTPPLIHEDLTTEAAITPWIQGTRAERGTALNATEQVAELLGRLDLAVPPRDVLGFGDVVWGLLLATVGGDHRLAKGSPIDIEAMRTDSERLLRAPNQSTLLHGDLTTGNLILTGDRAWALDPRPHLGPVEWDAATWCLWAGKAETLAQHLDTLVRAVGFDRGLLVTALRFQAAAFLAYRAEVGLDLPPDVLAMTRIDLSLGGEGGTNR